MTAAAPPLERSRASAVDSGRALFWRLIWIYMLATGTAVTVSMGLGLLGLEFTPMQWLKFWICVPFATAFFTSIDMVVIRWHLKPLAPVLSALDRGERPPDAILAAAVVRALNLPQISAVRVTVLHGPMATLSLFMAVYAMNTFMGAGVANWQQIGLAVLILVFASPAHAIFEYFAVSRTIEPIVQRLSRELGGLIPAEQAAALIEVPLRSKLLFLAVFVCALPLIFAAGSFLYKFDRMVAGNGFVLPAGELTQLYIWSGAVVTVCIMGAVAMAVLTSNEVSRSAARLVEAMRQVERGRLDDADVAVLTADEYAQINRGFGLMLASLREEQQILEVTQDLAGELLLEVLIERIMHATTGLLNAERASLFVYDEKAEELFTLYADGVETRGIHVPTSRGIAGAVFTTGSVENIADAFCAARSDLAAWRSALRC